MSIDFLSDSCDLPALGETMEDGTIYAGTSPDTGSAMFVTPEDEPFTMNYKSATKYAAEHEAHGHDDWKLPSLKELKVIFNNRAAIGGFDESNNLPTNRYHSSTEELSITDNAYMVRFNDGSEHEKFKTNHASLRLVRTC